MNIDFSDMQIYDIPFRHIVVKNFIKFEPELLKTIEKAFLNWKDNIRENENYSKVEIKKADGEIAQLLSLMSGNVLNNFCKENFDIADLTPDPEFDGGGLTFTDVNKYLRYHFDFPYSNIAKKFRVINALLYLSDPNIQGGRLQLLDPNSGTVEAEIAPVFGTLAIFPTSKYTPHGFSIVRSHQRISINSYFYSAKPLDDRVEPSKTVWMNSPHGFRH